MSRLAGKIAIVTGGAVGIGKATAQLFAKRGAAVCTVDLPTVELERTVTEIDDAGGNIYGYEADVADEGQVETYVRATEEKYGGVDIFCNNAGIAGPLAPFEKSTNDAFDEVMDVNVKSVLFRMKHGANAMKRHGGGTIVNTASCAGLRGASNLLPYMASKFAVVGMTKTAAIELAPAKIRVNVVCPGLIQTRMGQGLLNFWGENVLQQFLDTVRPRFKGHTSVETTLELTLVAFFITGL